MSESLNDRPRSPETKRLVSELRTHQVELEIQNEELRKVRDELEESRDRYRELYDLAPVAHLTLDRDGMILEANQATHQLLGLDHEQLIGLKLSALMNVADADAFHFYRGRVFATNTLQSSEFQVKTSDGRCLTLHLDSVAYQRPDAACLTCRSVAIDLSALRQAESGRLAQESRSRSLLDTATDAVIGIDAQARIEDFNLAAVHMFGYQKEEVAGRNVRMLMPSPYREQHDGFIENYLRTGNASILGKTSREVVGKRKDGSTFPVELGIGEWFDDGRQKFLGILRDLTERKRAESQLRESEERFRGIARYIALYVHEKDCTISYVSPAYEELWGRPAADLFRTSNAWIETIHPDDRQRVAAAYQVMRAGQPFTEEYRIEARGRICWVRDLALPILDQQDQFQGNAGVVRDITHERELATELSQAQKMEAVGALASGVAHDFNNGLQAILGCVNLALGDASLSERTRSFLQRAAGAARRGGALADQLVAFARKKTPEPQPTRIDSLLLDLAPLIERLATERVRLNIETDAPYAQVLADPVQIQQILLNLAANARDAIPEAGRLTIRTRELALDGASAREHTLNPTGRSVRIEVQDTGTGMDVATQSRIFEPFFTTKEIGQGTGLGLSTVFWLVKQLAGTIAVQSKPDAGTTITIELPCCDDLATESEDLGSPPVFTGTALLIEDEQVVLMTVRLQLEEIGFEVLAADSVSSARQLCARHTGAIHVLVLDVMMPEMQTAQFAASLRQDQPDVCVLFISAHPYGFLVEKGYLSPHASFLRKPFGRQELAAKLTELMADGALQPMHSAKSAVARNAARTILLVEDEPTARLVLGDLLESCGYQLFSMSHPSKALSLDAPIDLLLTDVRLPELDGVSLAAQLRPAHPAMKVVFMSGHPDAPSDGDAFFQKPFDYDQLLETIEGLLAD